MSRARTEARVSGEAAPATESILDALSAIQLIGERFTATLRLEAVLDQVIESAMRLAGGDSGSVMLLSDDGRELVVAAAVGPRASIIIGTRQPATASVAGHVLQSNSHVLLRGPAGGNGGPASDHPQDLSWGVVLPLRVTGRLLGVLNVNTRIEQRELPAERVSLLNILASQASIMIEVGRLYQDLARKEQRLELFVDRFLRMQAEQRQGGATGGGRTSALTEGVRPVGDRQAAGLRGPASLLPEEPPERLSSRELEVLTLIVEGLTNKEIATRLCLSPDTIKNHVVHIIQKLGVSDRTQAAVMAVRQGMIS